MLIDDTYKYHVDKAAGGAAASSLQPCTAQRICSFLCVGSLDMSKGFLCSVCITGPAALSLNNVLAETLKKLVVSLLRIVSVYPQHRGCTQLSSALDRQQQKAQ